MLKEKSKKDFYTKKARQEGYPARSVYKLREIDEKHHLIKEGDRVLDLGCAPGSWLSYISEKIGQKGRVFGIDIADIKIPLQNNMAFLKKDIFELTDSDFMKFNVKYNVIVSDLAPKTSGIRFVDVEKSLELCEKSFEIAQKILMTGGNFLCKIFEGESTKEFFNKIKRNFKFAKRFKPKASRKESKEIFIVGRYFQGSSNQEIRNGKI